MNPEAAAFLRKSREFLAKAQDLLDAHRWPDEAGRAAYLAGFHAAQAFLFESTGKVFKSHRGVQKEFLRLTKDDPRFDLEFRAFLGRAYNLKTIADYRTVPASQVCQPTSHAMRLKRRAGLCSVWLALFPRIVATDEVGSCARCGWPAITSPG
jgi:uncharacterized protein (UPF0332 family)